MRNFPSNGGNVFENAAMRVEEEASALAKQDPEAVEREEMDAKVASQEKASEERLAARLASSTLPALWLELERIQPFESAGGKDTDEVSAESSPAGQAAAVAARLSIDGRSLHVHGLSCPARLPLRFFQLADLACITKLVLREIMELAVLELAMFTQLKELEALTVSACPALKAVVLTRTSRVDGACKLQRLDFSTNPLIVSLPLQAVAEMPSIRELACHSCPNLWSPPQEVAQLGGEKCIDFIRSALKAGAANTRMTLFLLGDGEAGKTSVFRALKSASSTTKRLREDMRTVGIDMEEWLPETAGAAGKALGSGGALSFRVLDLAGQAVYEMTHQFFLLQRAVYIFVWRAFALADDRRAVLEDRVKHWMDSLQLRVPGACVMIVVTHIDSVSAVALDVLCGVVRDTVRACLAAMRRTAPRGARVLSVLNGGESQRVNCLLGEGVAVLREKLLDFARAMPWYGELLPASFVSVREAVERLVEGGKQHMLIGEWVQLCTECQMNGPMLAVGTQYLHETGIVRFFGDVSTLAAGGSGDTVVYLSAEFMVSVMKGLVRHDRQALQVYFVETHNKRMLRRTNRLNVMGRLHESLAPYLWPTTEHSRAYWDWARRQGQREAELWRRDVVVDTQDLERALGLLEGFDLMVRLKDDLELLVPGALPPTKTQVSADAFAPNVDVPFTASRSYPALPAGAFQRVVVRVAGQADWSDFSTERAVFYLLGNMATLNWSDTASPNEEKRAVLQWRASNEQLRAIIAEAVDKIERFFPGLHRLPVDTQANHPAFAREPAQVLVLAATDEAAKLVQAAVNAADEMMELVVEMHGPRSEQTAQADFRRVRVLLACMTPEFSASNISVGEVEAFLRAGHSRVITVLLAGFDVSTSWKSAGVRLLSTAQWGAWKQLALIPSADLRECSVTRFHMDTEVRQEVNTDERARMARMARSAREGKSAAMAHQHIQERVTTLTDERLKKQALEAAAVVRIRLLPRVKQMLRTWRAQSPAESYLVVGLSTGFTAAPGHDVVRCGANHGGGETCGHAFSRKDLEKRRDAKVMNATVTPTGDDNEIASIRCHQCRTDHRVRDLLAPPEVRPCPACARKGAEEGGYFCARECRLRMGEGLEQRIYEAPCKVCGEQVSLFDVFPPEVYCSLNTPANELPALMSDLIKAIEVDADVLVWAARREGQRRGGADAESRRALALAPVVLLFLTEEYATSLECAAEMREAVKAGKLIVPVLLQGLAREAEQAFPSQGVGQPRPEAEAFWRGLATHRLQRHDALDWTLLGDRAPLVAAPERSRRQSDSAASDEPVLEAWMSDLVCAVSARIASHLHRAVKLNVFSDLSRFGVRLSYFREFVNICGGRSVLEKLTTGAVKEKFVMPLTKDSQLSLCEQLLLEENGADFVATAKVFLSHAWTYPFLDVLDAVERRFSSSQDPNPVVWFDIFSVSQHKSDERDFTW